MLIFRDSSQNKLKEQEIVLWHEEMNEMSRDPAVTSKIMSAIKSKNTRPELLLRKILWHRGLRFRINYKTLPGKPDVVFTKAKIAVFCDGDYWHGHNWVLRGIPSLKDELSGYSEFWKNKILGNIKRDEMNTTSLEAEGWRVIRLWESDINSDVSRCADIIETEYHCQIKKLTYKRKL